MYSLANFYKIGYVKVVIEVLIEVILRINFESGFFWELECLKFYLLIEICSDIIFGLIRLVM